MHGFKLSAFIYGLFFTIFGVIGFLNSFFFNDLLLGIFKVGSVTNIIHILTGVIGLIVMWNQNYYIRLYFQLVGFVYAALAVLGFLYSDTKVLGIIGHNAFLTWLHVITAVLALIIGFGTNNKFGQENKR